MVRLALFTLFAGPAVAQVSTECRPRSAGAELRVGYCFRSAIGPNDPKNRNGIPYQDWRLDMDQGETVQIDLDSLPTVRPAASGQATPTTFDTYLEVRREGVDAPLATNDDRVDQTAQGERYTLNSRIRFVAPARGSYVVRARPLLGGEGDYQLTVRRPPRTPPPISVAPGRIRLDFSTAARGEAGDLRTLVYTFGGTAGQVVRFAVEAGARPDHRLRLTGPNDVVLADVAGADHSLAAILTVPGTYRLRLQMDPSPGWLIFQRKVPGDSPTPDKVSIGETVTGELGYDSRVELGPSGDGRFFYELYELELPADQPVTVSLTSDDFDTVLDAGTLSSLGFAMVRTNDDADDSLNSRLVLRQKDRGAVFLRVRAVGNGIGRFQLRVTPGEPPAAPAPAPR